MKFSYAPNATWSRKLLDVHLRLSALGKRRAPTQQQQHIVHYINRGAMFTFYFAIVMLLVFLRFKLWNIVILMVPIFTFVTLSLAANYMGYFTGRMIILKSRIYNRSIEKNLQIVNNTPFWLSN